MHISQCSLTFEIETGSTNLQLFAVKIVLSHQTRVVFGEDITKKIRQALCSLLYPTVVSGLSLIVDWFCLYRRNYMNIEELSGQRQAMVGLGNETVEITLRREQL